MVYFFLCSPPLVVQTTKVVVSTINLQMFRMYEMAWVAHHQTHTIHGTDIFTYILHLVDFVW